MLAVSVAFGSNHIWPIETEPFRVSFQPMLCWSSTSRCYVFTLRTTRIRRLPNPGFERKPTAGVVADCVGSSVRGSAYAAVRRSPRALGATDLRREFMDS